MLETPDETELLQQLLDRSAAGAGPHLRGPAFQAWLDQADAIGARIAAEKMFTFSAAG